MLMTVEASGPPAANSALKGLMLQTVTMAVRMMKGDQALMTAPAVSGAPEVMAGAATAAALPPSPSVSKRKMRLGCQTLRNSVSATSETMAEVMSGSSGPMKLAVRNCTTAKEPPPTSTAGQVSLTPRQPSMMAISQNSTSTVMKGSWRPAIWPMANASTPETCPATMMGMPMAPKATGAVLAIRRSEEHTSELQSPCNLVCRLLLEKKKNDNKYDRQKHEHIPILSC